MAAGRGNYALPNITGSHGNPVARSATFSSPPQHRRAGHRSALEIALINLAALIQGPDTNRGGKGKTRDREEIYCCREISLPHAFFDSSSVSFVKATDCQTLIGSLYWNYCINFRFLSIENKYIIYDFIYR